METLNLDFLRNASGVGTGPIFENERYSLAVIQIAGTFAGLSLILEGRTDIDAGPWETVAGWSVSDPGVKIASVSAKGIYEYPIEGERQIRFRVASIEGGTVTATGVFYDPASRTTYPFGSANAPTFGDPALFVKGVAEQIFFDPSTGNIVGYDSTATEGSVSITANLAEITGGMGNQLIGVLPDTARISGTYTSSAFSLETRERIMGGQIAYNAVSQVCETVTAESTVLTVSKMPAPSLAEDSADAAYWCHVRRVGDGAWRGMNAKVDPATRAVLNYAAEAGKKYEVTYFAHVVSAATLPIPTVWNPVMMTVQIRYGVYARQNGSAERGILRGWLYFIVPRAILNADAGVCGSQTSNADTAGGWTALPERPENMPLCDCSNEARPLAYYVYVPCSGVNDAVDCIVSVGSGMTLKAGRSAQLPLKFVMPDDTLIQPDFATLGYYSVDESVAVVDNAGIVTGVSEGETSVWSYATKSDGSTMACRTVVVVEGTQTVLSSMRDHIIYEE